MVDNSKFVALRQISIIIVIIVALDRISKALAIAYLQPLHSVSVIGDFFRLTYIENTGMAFGIEIHNKFLFNSLSILAVLFILFYLVRLFDFPKLRIAFAVILGGAIGNLWDRLFYGRVVDFFDIDFIDVMFPAGTILIWDFPGYFLRRWPVFNIADIAVFCSMIIVINWAISDLSPKNQYGSIGNEKV